MWQFAEAVRGLADGCAELGIPVTGGNVSFYNQTGDEAINPTLVVGVLGVIDDVRRRTPVGLPASNAALLLLGDTRVELSGSEWAWVMHDHLGGVPPVVDLDAEQRLGMVLSEAAADGLVASAHDVSDGGLAQTLVEACLRTGVGASVAVPEEDPCGYLFSESAGRALVAVHRDAVTGFGALCREYGVPAAEIGSVDPTSDALVVNGQFTVTLDELAQAHQGTLPQYFG